jgi:endonuclease-3 related protein
MDTEHGTIFIRLYELLLESYGPRGWWPLLGRVGQPGFDAEGYHPGFEPELSNTDRFEIAVGAILTQNTSWINVRRALGNLSRHVRDRCTMLSPEAVLDIGTEVLAGLIRSSGYYNQKARKLMRMSSMFAGIKGVPERDGLLNLWGIGPETADSILLYAFDGPVFVIDAYTRRILSRVAGFELDASDQVYHRLQSTIQNALPRDTGLYREYHALLVEHGKNRCLKRDPLCSDCPVRGMCDYIVQKP